MVGNFKKKAISLSNRYNSNFLVLNNAPFVFEEMSVPSLDLSMPKGGMSTAPEFEILFFLSKRLRSIVPVRSGGTVCAEGASLCPCGIDERGWC